MSPAGYDVFICFSPEDTSNNFTGHLLAALYRRGISVFKGFDGLSTQDLPSHDVIEKSRVSVIVLSKNFGSSFHCLNDLAKILECRQRSNLVVFPVFYQVSPSDLHNGMGIFGGAFRGQGKVSADQMKSWSTALREVNQMPGYALADRSESELIDEIVNDVFRILHSSNNENLIAMDSKMEQLLSLLCIQSPDVRSLGIWGMGGIGKTAIAREILHRISGQYQGCFFLEDLHGAVQIKGHDSVREQFFSQILDVETHILRTSDIGTSFLRSRLRRKRVLVVLDNVNNFKDVETLVGKLDSFGPGSRMIITSRNRHVLVQCKVNNIYEVKPLDIHNSALLFCYYAFPNNRRGCAYWKESLRLVKIAEGNPFVLKVLGLFLQGKPRQEFDSLSQRFRQTPPNEIQDMLERSYCGLDDNEKSIFLDIASFFRGKDKDDVAALLDGCGFFAHVGISGLIAKSLITILEKKLDMHNLIQDMGQRIVHQQSAKPRWRSRLWDPNDIKNVFIENSGTPAIEGIFLDMSKVTFDASPAAFEEMYNLRLIKFYCSNREHHGVSLSQGLDYLPGKLRLLHWEVYPLSSLPRNFDSKNLVELNLPNSCIEKLWKGTMNLEKLKKMRLSYSQRLIEIRKLSRAQNLEHIDLEGCKSLVKISSSICHLKELVCLSLKDCPRLQSFPSVIHLKSLEVLNLSGCSGLEIFPEISPNVKELYLGGTAIREVPPSIKNLAKLVKLDMECCRRLENLPTSISKLKYLEILNLSGCSRLNSFPELSRNMKSLWLLDLSKTAIKELSSSILYLIGLQELRLVNCRNLAKVPDNLLSLKALRKIKVLEGGADISNSGKDLVGLEDFSSLMYEDPDHAGAVLHFLPSLHPLAFRLHLVNLCLQNTGVLDIPEELCGLPSLHVLDLSGNVFQKLPENIAQLSKMESLNLSSCKRLKSIPELPRSLAYLDAHGCKSLEKIAWKLEQNPKIWDNCLEMPGCVLAKALVQTRSKQKQEFQASSRASSLTICFPTNAQPKLLNFVNAGSYTFLRLPSSWLNSNLLGLALFVVVAFEKDYHNESDFAIRCMCNLKFPSGVQRTLERVFYCWTQNKRETRIRGDHVCIIYDCSLLEPLVMKNDVDISAYYSFYAVDGQNRLLAGCTVTSCAVNLLTVKHEKRTVAESYRSESQNLGRSSQSDIPESSTVAKNETSTDVSNILWNLRAVFVSGQHSMDLDKSKRSQKTESEKKVFNADAASIQDGYKWKKYRQKDRLLSKSRYYKCAYPNCAARKKTKSNGGRGVEVTYTGKHAHHKPPRAQHVTLRLLDKPVDMQQDASEQSGFEESMDEETDAESAFNRAPGFLKILTKSQGLSDNTPRMGNSDKYKTEEQAPLKRPKLF